jgi:hypothetical protein
MPRNRLPGVMKLYSPTGRRNHCRPLKRLMVTWDRNGSTSSPTPWQINDNHLLWKIRQSRWQTINEAAKHFTLAMLFIHHIILCKSSIISILNRANVNNHSSCFLSVQFVLNSGNWSDVSTSHIPINGRPTRTFPGGAISCYVPALTCTYSQGKVTTVYCLRLQGTWLPLGGHFSAQCPQPINCASET